MGYHGDDTVKYTSVHDIVNVNLFMKFISQDIMCTIVCILTKIHRTQQ